MEKEFFEIVGEITPEIAININYEAAKIVMNQQSLKHISEDHATELANVGMTAVDFVKFVVTNFNEIRQGKSYELFLIVKNGLSKVAIIRMFYDKGYYIVETATTMPERYLNKKELIWFKERTL